MTRVSLKTTFRAESKVRNNLGCLQNPYKAENRSIESEFPRNCFYPAVGGVVCDNTNKMENISEYQKEYFKGTPPAEPLKGIPPAFFSPEEGRVTAIDKKGAGGPPLKIQRGGANMEKKLEDNLSNLNEGGP